MRQFLALLLCSPLARADVLVVSPSGPYTQIQAAVDAANDGDVVLVKAGTYAGFLVSGKSLAIVGEAAPSIEHVQGAASVCDLATGQTVSLIGLRTEGNAALPPRARFGLYANNNSGSLRCEACEFRGATWTFPWLDGWDGAWVGRSADVSFVNCVLWGGSGGAGFWPWIGTAGAGLRAENSGLTVHGTHFHGGSGQTSTYDGGDGGIGGAGIHASASNLFVSDSVFEGGQGGFGTCLAGPCPGDGGPGANLDTGSLMHVLASPMLGGHDGSQYHFQAPAHVGATYDFLSGTPRWLQMSNPVREATTLHLTFVGAGGESVQLLVGSHTSAQWDPARLGNFMIAPPDFRTLTLGTTAGGGMLQVDVPLSDLGTGVQSCRFYLQPVFVDSAGTQQLGTPISLVALDAAY